MKSQKPVSDACRQLLTAQQISPEGPGTILRDIETLITFIGERGLLTKSKQGNLPPDVLPGLNAHMAQPIEVYLERPQLRDFPNIGGMFVLLRVMDFVRVEGKLLRIDPARLALWRTYNPAEKYFTLLEAWLFHADAAVLGGEDRRRLNSQFAANLRFLVKLKTTQWTTFDEYCHLYEICGAVSTWNTQLHVMFGLIEVQSRSLLGRKGEGSGWLMEKGRRTLWGEAVGGRIVEALQAIDEALLYYLDPPEAADFGTLQPAFQAYFPEWQKTYALPQQGAQSGIYIFKVSLTDHRANGEVWRRLAVPGHVSLDELADAVLQAFDFSDREHLYEFRYRDRLGKGQVYFHPETEEGPYAHELEIQLSGLPEKGVMKFRFDYGDDWRFELKLERIDPLDKKMKHSALLESFGKAPAQNPDWD